MIAAVVCRGFGPAASIAFVCTRGFNIGVVPLAVISTVAQFNYVRPVQTCLPVIQTYKSFFVYIRSQRSEW